MDWAFSAYPPSPEEGHQQSEVRSGEVWTRTLWAIPLSSEVCGFPGAKYALKMEREVVRKGSGECRREVSYAVTSLEGSLEEFYRLWRGHWEVENRLFHPRDVVFGEDVCRIRRGGAGLMYLRDVLINLLRLAELPILRSVRRFSANVHELYRLLRGSGNGPEVMLAQSGGS